MPRFLPALLAMLAAAVIAIAQDAPKAPDAKSLLEEFQDARTDYLKTRRSAGSRTEAARLSRAWKDTLAGYNQRFVKLAEKDPKGSEAVELLFTVLDNIIDFGGEQELTTRTLAALQRDHLKSDELGGYLPLLAHIQDPAAESLLREVREKNPHKNVRALADFSLADALLRKAHRASMVHKLSTEQRKEVEADWGKQTVEKLLALDIAETNREAEDLFEQVEKKHGDVVLRTESGRTTLAKLAGNRLYEVRNLSVGRPALEIVSEDLDGKKVKLSDLKGKVVVLNFWATWCGPCRGLIPHERELVEKLKDKPFVFVSVNMDENKSNLKKFLEKERMPWVHWWCDSEGDVADAWRISSFPTIYVLDAKGVIRFKDVRDEEMDEAVEKLLAEMEADSTVPTKP